MSKVKGTKIKSKLNYLKERYDQATVERVMRSLSTGDRVQIESIVDLGWYEMDLFKSLIQAILAVAAGGDEQVLADMGRYGAEDLSLHAYKVYFRSGDPEVVLSKMVPIHSMLNDPGVMEIQKLADKQLNVVVSEPRSALPHCQIARAFYQRSVELCGVSNVQVDETACSAEGADACEFLVSWE